jgi:hypothetical protein
MIRCRGVVRVGGLDWLWCRITGMRDGDCPESGGFQWSEGGGETNAVVVDGQMAVHGFMDGDGRCCQGIAGRFSGCAS